MQRSNDNSNQTTAQLRQTVQTLALRVNQLERLLDGKELREAKVENGTVYQRGTRLSLSNGMVAPGWNATTVTGGTTGTGGIDYDYLFVGTTKVTPPAKTTDFLQITLGASPSAAWVAAMPVTEGSNTVTYDVTKNRIYLSGEFGG